MSRRPTDAVFGALLFFSLACAGLSAGEEPAGPCSASALLGVIQVSNPKAQRVGKFACKHDYALAAVHSDAKGTVPQLLYFLAKKDDSWEVVGLSKEVDVALCEEAHRLSFDQCQELWSAFEAAKTP